MNLNASVSVATVNNDTTKLNTGWTSLFQTGYHEILEMKPDPRVDDWLLMGSPWPTIWLCTAYVVLVKIIGPWVMRDRPPFDLRWTLVIYNGIQVIFSAWLFSMGTSNWLSLSYSFSCQPVDFSKSPSGVAVAASCWWYFISKFTEFVDTLFFVLRKKDRHISFLHAFHHGMMPIATWLIVKYVPGGHSTFPGMINTFIHVIMYTYYMIAAMGPKFEKYIWWKKYLTRMQMIQFTIVAAHSGQQFFVQCNYPKFFALFFFVNSLIFLSLFSNFYGTSYKKSHSSSKTTFDHQKLSTKFNHSSFPSLAAAAASADGKEGKLKSG